jgi:hypothetical protein
MHFLLLLVKDHNSACMMFVRRCHALDSHGRAQRLANASAAHTIGGYDFVSPEGTLVALLPGFRRNSRHQDKLLQMAAVPSEQSCLRCMLRAHHSL